MSVAKEGYGFHPEFERVVMYFCASSAQFWARVGNGLDPECVGSIPARLVLEACRLIQHTTGKGPGSLLLLLQRLRRLVADGKLKLEFVVEVNEYFDAAEDFGLPSEELVVQELVPIIRRRMQAAAIEHAVKAHTTRGDMTKVRSMLDQADRVGALDASAETYRIDVDGFAAIREQGNVVRLSTGILELDLQLNYGMPVRSLGVFLGGSGDGKCHPAGQGVLRADGSRAEVQHVRVGDQLLGPGGAVRTVLQTNVGYGDIFEVVPLTGDPWRCNADHILTLSKVRRGKGTLRDVSLREWMQWSVYEKAQWKMIRSKCVEFGEGKPLSVPAYFLGVLLGDGSMPVGGSISVCTPDQEIVKELEAAAKKYSLRLRKASDHRKSSQYHFVDRPGHKHGLIRDLESLGIRGAACGQKYIPNHYKVASVLDRLELLAGLMDTDGSVNRTAYEYSSKSWQLAKDVAFVARSLGFCATVKAMIKRDQHQTAGLYYRVSIFGDGVDRIPVRVVRKKLPVRRQVKDALHTGFSVRHVGQEPYYGFSLDGDSRYLLDDFTITHNSMSLMSQACTAVRMGKFTGFITLELPRPVQLARCYANLTGLEVDMILENDKTLLEAERRMKLMAPAVGICVVADMPPQATSVRQVVEWVIEQEQKIGRKMEVLVVDYADKMSDPAQKDSNEYLAMRAVYEGLRRELAVARDMWVWTASAGSRPQKDNHKRLDLKDIADSMHKARVADLVISLNVREEGSEMLFYVAKNRHGRSRFEVGPLPTDWSRGRMVPLASEWQQW